ncbi:MAG: type II toxin-antitoxin system RelE/ParE family toxin [Candidatus Shapirobacteria bacterium]
MYSYFFSPAALRQVKKLPKNIQTRIIKKLDFFCKNDPLVYSDNLIDFRLGGYRLRVGDYRIIFDKEEDDSILVLKIGHRRDIYK